MTAGTCTDTGHVCGTIRLETQVPEGEVQCCTIVPGVRVASTVHSYPIEGGHAVKKPP